MKILTQFICLIFFAFNAKANDFDINKIPVGLIKNANVVIRLDRTTFVIHSLTATTLRRQIAVTVLNSAGDEHARFEESYDKLRKLGNISGILYDASGKVLKKLKQKDIRDVTDVSEENLMDDNRRKLYDFAYHQYPYTVEYSWDVSFNHTFQFPRWTPLGSEKISVQDSRFTVEFPLDYDMRYRQFNLKNEPLSASASKMKSLTWSVTDLPPLEMPEQFVNWRKLIPMVLIAPSDFQLDNIKGSMSDWKSFGTFIHKLIEGKDELPTQMKTTVASLIQGLQTDEEKIRALYGYMQKNTRYISVQLGVGGWVPFDAAYVAKRGYGDCKALTNFTHSLLKEAGIASFYTLVFSGRSSLAQDWTMPDFSSNQFNHVILAVPVDKDTMWLECTSSTLPAGYTGGSTANRNALIIRSDGGYLVQTPRYGLNENQQNREVHAAVDDAGTAEVQVKTEYSGLRQDFLFGMIHQLPQPKVKEFLSASIPLASFELQEFNYATRNNELPFLSESLRIKALNYATVSGKRLFITPNILSRQSFKLTIDERRTADFDFSDERRETDKTVIVLPAGYMIEAAMTPVEVRTDFGYYKMQCDIKDNYIVFERIFEQYKTVVPVDRQAEVVSFYQKVFDSDRARLVFVKPGSN